MVSARTGSAPENATTQLLRSSDGSSSGLTFLTQMSKAKFGAPLVVIRYFEIVRSQRTGFFKNARGDIKTQGIPMYMGWMTFPISPMSWYSGSQLMQLDARVNSK